MNITYYHHSGFSAAIDDILLVFDYWRGENGELPPDKRIIPEELAHYSEVYVFVSHEHEDHFDESIYEWKTVAPVTYLIAGDMPAGKRGRRLQPGDEVWVSPRVHVKAYPSTDLGVSFMVDVNGIRLFHAGDLNFWHWRDESTIQEIEEAEKSFHEAVKPIVNDTAEKKIDVAFFPVDPRQGRMFDAGANYFALTVKPRLMIPMHFWGRGEAAHEYARRSRSSDTEILALTRFGEAIRLECREDGSMVVHLLTAPVPVYTDMAPRTSAGEGAGLRAFTEESPFLDTDLPVTLDDDDDEE